MQRTAYKLASNTKLNSYNQSISNNNNVPSQRSKRSSDYFRLGGKVKLQQSSESFNNELGGISYSTTTQQAQAKQMKHTKSPYVV